MPANMPATIPTDMDAFIVESFAASGAAEMRSLYYAASG
jgi:hypothetical protein